MVTETQATDARDAMLGDIDAGDWTETGEAPYVEAETPDGADPQWCVAEFERDGELLHVWQLAADRFQVCHEDDDGVTWGRVYGRVAMAAHVTDLAE